MYVVEVLRLLSKSGDTTAESPSAKMLQDKVLASKVKVLIQNAPLQNNIYHVIRS